MSDRAWGNSHPGRRPGFAVSDVDLLKEAELYERITPRPTQAGFVSHAQLRTKQTEDGHTVSMPQFRTWIKGYGMDYPMVPNMDDQERPILVFLVEADPRAKLTWISKNVDDVLGFQPEDLVGRRSVDALHGGHDPRSDNPELVATFSALKAGKMTDGVSPPTFLVHHDGHRVPVQLHAGYGTHNRSFYIQATVLQPVDAQPSGAATDTEFVRLLVKGDPAAYREYFEKHIPPYRYPGTRESDTYNVEPFIIHGRTGKKKAVRTAHSNGFRSALAEIEHRLRRATQSDNEDF